MADIKLFNVSGPVREYEGGTVTLEKELQNIIEANMQTFFGVTFLASEYSTTDGGRMDSIGIDENNCPAIFEYKRSMKDNVINQGLFYLNWLLDHKDSFKVLVIEKLGLKAAENIDWTMPRVVCIAGDFTKYDESAIKQMNRNITLIRYKKFGEDLLMFEQLNENVAPAIQENSEISTKAKSTGKSFEEHFQGAKPELQMLYEDCRYYILSLGDDITENQLKFYTAYRKIRNFTCIEIIGSHLLLHLRLDVNSIEYEDGFSRDTSKIGHYATGDVELKINSRADLEKAKPLLDRAYNEN